MNEQQTVESKILTQEIQPKLKLTENELEALNLLAEVNDQTVEHIVNTMIHSGVYGELDEHVVHTTRGRRLMQELKAQEDQMWDEYHGRKVENPQEMIFTLEGDSARKYAKASEDGQVIITYYPDDEPYSVEKIEFSVRK